MSFFSQFQDFRHYSKILLCFPFCFHHLIPAWRCFFASSMARNAASLCSALSLQPFSLLCPSSSSFWCPWPQTSSWVWAACPSLRCSNHRPHSQVTCSFLAPSKSRPVTATQISSFPVSVQSDQPLNECPGPLRFLPASAATLSWSCPCSSLRPLPFERDIFLQHLQLEHPFYRGTNKWWVNSILIYTSRSSESLYLLLFLFLHLFLILKLHLGNYSGIDLLWVVCSCIGISTLLCCIKGWDNNCPCKGHLKSLVFLLPRGWVRQLLSLQVTFSCKTTLWGCFSRLTKTPGETMSALNLAVKQE